MSPFKLREQVPLFAFVAMLFVMGVLFGALMVNQLTLGQKQDLSAYLGHFFQTFNQTESLQSHTVFVQSLISNLKWILLITLMGLSVIGLPFVLILNFLKGALLGFTVRYLIDRMAWKGVIMTFISVTPQQLLMIPALFIISVVAIAYSLYVIKYRRLTPMVWNLTKITIVMCLITFMATLFETFVTPKLLLFITPWLLAN
jgi:stage II sporulation protein M